MKTRIKMIGLFSVVAIMISLLAVGYLMARPNDAPSGAVAGTVTLTGGFTNLSLKTFYSAKTGKNIVTVTITDADLSSVRTGTVVYGVASPVNVNADPLFTISGADGVSIGAGAVGVLQGETEVTVKFDGDAAGTAISPLTTTTSAITAGAGQSVISLGRPIRDRDGSGIVGSGDVTFTLGTTITDRAVNAAAADGRVTVLAGSDVFEPFTSPVVTGGTTSVTLTHPATETSILPSELVTWLLPSVLVEVHRRLWRLPVSMPPLES